VKKEHLWLLGAFLVGVMASGKVRTLPGLNKLPSF
jgi:hypothetical protein